MRTRKLVFVFAIILLAFSSQPSFAATARQRYRDFWVDRLDSLKGAKEWKRLAEEAKALRAVEETEPVPDYQVKKVDQSFEAKLIDGENKANAALNSGLWNKLKNWSSQSVKWVQSFWGS